MEPTIKEAPPRRRKVSNKITTAKELINYLFGEYDRLVCSRAPEDAGRAGWSKEPMLDKVNGLLAGVGEWWEIDEDTKLEDLVLIPSGDWVGLGYWDQELEDEGGQCWRWYAPDRERIEPIPTLWKPRPAPPKVS